MFVTYTEHAKTFDFETDSGNIVACFEMFHACLIIDTKNWFSGSLEISLSSFTGNGLSKCLNVYGDGSDDISLDQLI